MRSRYVSNGALPRSAAMSATDRPLSSGWRPAQVGPLARVTEQRHQRLVPQVEHGLGQRAGQARREIGVHVVVGRDVEAIATRLLDERQVGAGVLAGAHLGALCETSTATPHSRPMVRASATASRMVSRSPRMCVVYIALSLIHISEPT